MKNLHPGISMRLIALAIALVVLAAPVRAESRSYILATATTGGTYYPVGVALSTLTKVKLEPKHKLSLSAISSAGSGENIKLLREGEAQFAILQGLYGLWAEKGTGQLRSSGKQEHLRSVTMLWQNVEQFVVKSDLVQQGTLSDIAQLKGKKFSIGKRNSGTEGSGREILGNLGFEPDEDLVLVYQGYGPSAESLQNGNIVGMNIPAGVPTSAITRAFANLGDAITILGFSDSEIARVNREAPLWTRYIIPANTYPGQARAVNTVAQPNFLAVHENVPEEDVYLIVKTVYANLPFLVGIHKATKAMALDKAIAGLPNRLHPGALRFYREQGLDVPDYLQ